MMRFRRLLASTFAVAILVTAAGGLGQGSLLQTASAAGCEAPSIGFGRYRWCGYWYNKYQDEGESVRIGGVPGSVNTASDFVNLLKSDLASGNQNKITGAKFVILTMIGVPPPSPAPASGSAKTLTAAQMADWESRVRTYANLSENGTTSYGTNGRIDWFASLHRPCGGVNTYWQPAHNDVAPFTDTPANSDCEIASSRDIFIVFRDKSGNEVYKIRRACMNPMGNIDPLTTNPAPSFNLTPTVSPTIAGPSGPVPGSVAQPGDAVTFRYVVNNTGANASVGTTCALYANTRNGYVATPTPATASSNGPFVPPATTCPSAMPRGSTTIATESRLITVTDINKTICRSLFVNPATLGGPARGSETCIVVASKPYLKVFGGDVSVGGGYETAPNTCSANNNAAIVAWNNRSGRSYSGAGVQYAAQALANINDFATAQNAGASANAPSALALASTTANIPSGRFGGSFGSAPCIKDYYGSLAGAGAATLSTASLSAAALPDGASSRVGGGLTTIGAGTIGAGKHVRLYVDGDVFISGNITFPASYGLADMPTFQLIVRGNIYIGGDVTELNGSYIAQPNGSAAGTIYTCATGASAIALDGSLYDTCNKKLIVNGAFVAKNVEFLRTNGSIYQSSAAETGTSSTIAEVFNYTPALWLRQPGALDGNAAYDAIASLPPVL